MGILDAPAKSIRAATDQILNPAALQPFWAGLAGCVLSPCDIVVIGDSRTEGTEGTGTPSIEDRWASQLRNFLRQQFQVPYGGPVGGRGYVPAWYAVSPVPTADQPTLAGAAVANFGHGLGRRNVVSSALIDTITWPSILCTSADLICSNLLTGTKFTGLFDADVATAFTTSASGGDRAFRVTPGAGRGSRALKAAWNTGSASAFNCPGAMFYDGDESAGIRLWDGAHHGFKTSDFTSFTQWTSAISNLLASSCKLVIYALGTNESTSAVSSATFKANMQSLIALVQAIVPASVCSHVLMMQPNRSSALQVTEPWANYVAAAKSIAQADTSIAYVDLGLSMPAADSDTLGVFGADHTHELAKGYRMEALALARAISPR